MDPRQTAKIFVVLSISVLAVSGAVAQPPFTEEAVQRGVDYVAWKNGDVGIAGQSQGAAFVDLDLDGDPDLILIGDVNGLVGVYENDGTGHFTKRSDTGMPILDHASAVTVADYDADGDLDVYITQFNNVALLPQPSGQNYLLRNDGGFTFTDVTVEANLYDLGASTGPTWGDYDGDGYLDLYVPNYTGSWEPTNNRLYHNLGDGTFEEIAAVLGVDDPGAGFQASFVDYDLDGDVDLYLVNDRGVVFGRPNRLWKNLGDGTFQDVSEESGADLAICGMGLAVGDIDRNGWPEFYVSNSNHNPLLMNQDGTAFVDQSVLWDVEGGLSGWGVMFFDMDNDAHLDIYVCNTVLGQSGLFADRLYDCDGGPPCSEIASEMGLNVDTPAYGVTSADIDNDGDLDFVVIRPSGKLPDWGILPVFMYRNSALASGSGSPPGKGPMRLAPSPSPGASTLITSAPYAASSLPQ